MPEPDTDTDTDTDTPTREELTGGCHCGAVRFRVRVTARAAVVCNCSICSKKGFVHLIVTREAFTLERGEDATTEYRFGTGTARHTFCRTCGIHAFYVPRSHPDGIDVNVRCLDGDPLPTFALTSFDGRHWEDNVGALVGAADPADAGGRR